MPPGVLRSRSFTRFTMRVGLPHLGQSVLLVVSIIFLRSAVLAILAMVECSPECLWYPRPYKSATANAAGNLGTARQQAVRPMTATI